MFGPPGSLRSVADFCAALLDQAIGSCAAIKPQMGLFEAFGPEGYALARDLSAQARAAGLPVILDAKRGDIGSTAEGYARALLGPSPGFDSDCVTVNPYMGLDTLEPFLAAAERMDKSVAVLVRTSNPGAADFQDLDVAGTPFWVRLAEALEPAQTRLQKEADWSDLMVVVGATWPDDARRLRRILSTALFLVPGFGAQGADATAALAGLPNGRGGVVNASRSILYAPAATRAGTLATWRVAIDEALADATAQLGKGG